ncbi:MAG: NDP-sugar synthase [Candidatus Margulisiibacteriota bacterium]
MKAVIIAGGLGTRLHPLTYNTPKPIVPVANRPFILHQIELLKQHGIKEIILNLHYMQDSIRNVLGDGKSLGVKLYYSIEETPLGTAGAVKNAEEYFDKEPLVVFNGDILTDINISQIVDYHKRKKSKATLTLTRVEDPTAYGLIISDKDGRISMFLEKPSWEQVNTCSAEFGSANTINSGIYVLDPAIFKKVPRGTIYSFERELFPSLLERGEAMFAYISDRYWMDIGKPGQYMEAHEAIMRNEVSVRLKGMRIDKKNWIGDRAKVSKTAKILGPAIIGESAAIDRDVRIKDYSTIGEKVYVGEGSVLERVIIWEGTKVGRHVVMNGCIIGRNCEIGDYSRIGEGVVLADNSVIGKGSIINA